MSKQYADFHDLMTYGPGIRLHQTVYGDSDEFRVFNQILGKGNDLSIETLLLTDDGIETEYFDREGFNTNSFFFDPKQDVGIMIWGQENRTDYHDCDYAYALIKRGNRWEVRGGCHFFDGFANAKAALDAALEFWHDCHDTSMEGESKETQRLYLMGAGGNDRVKANRDIRQVFKDIYAKIPRSEKPAAAPVRKAAKKAKKSKRTRR